VNALVDFVLPALLLSATAALALRLAPNAPPRVKFWIAMLGLGAWVVPWPLLELPAVLSSAAAAGSWTGASAARAASAKESLAALFETVPAPRTTVPSSAWLLLFVPGLYRFAADYAGHRRKLGGWRARSRDGAQLRARAPRALAAQRCTIRVVEGCTVAAATGLLRPVVWLGERLTGHGLETALTHELCHLRRRDPLWLLAIGLLARLYWWNPIVAAQARQATRWLEMTCDRDCARLLGTVRYGHALAELLLRAVESEGPALAPTIAGGSFNLRRLVELEREPRLGVRGTLAIAACALASVGAAAVGTALPDPRIGGWMEVSQSEAVSPIWRRFSDLGAGMTRVDSYIAPDGTVLAWSDHRCDGRAYPMLGPAGPLANTLACRRVGARRFEYVFAGVDAAQPAENAVEEISADGETYTLTVSRTGVGGRPVEVTHRVFWRLH
jgi:beta-lactamase regulating signal transducer with metallopeptidase domain